MRSFETFPPSILLLVATSLVMLTPAFPSFYETVYPPVNSSDNSSHVYIGLIVSFGRLTNSSGNVPGVKVALDLINAYPYLLPGYTLHYVLSDSQVSINYSYREATLSHTLCTH